MAWQGMGAYGAKQKKGHSMAWEMTEKWRTRLNALLELAKDVPLGDVIFHEDIEAASGLERRSPEYGYLIRLWERAMEQDRQITIDLEPGLGYCLAPPDRVLGLVIEKRARRAKRQFRRAARSLAALPNEGLSEFQRRLKNHRLRQVKEAEKQAADSARRVTLLSQPTQTVHRARKQVGDAE